MADVAVKLDCRRGLLHGSETIRKISVQTNDKGEFSFSSFQVWDCQFAYTTPAKEEFFPTAQADSRYADTRYEQIPQQLWLTPNYEKRMQRIKYHVALSQTMSTDLKVAYGYIYGDFISAAAIAKTDDEVRLVRQGFCARLSALDAQLSDDDRRELSQTHRGFPAKPTDHAQFVKPYCGQ